jgi:putative flippase GtrA
MGSFKELVSDGKRIGEVWSDTLKRFPNKRPPKKMEHNNGLVSQRIEKIRLYISRRRLTIAKFLVVSGSAVAINLGLLYLLVNYLGFDSAWGQNGANIISMEISIVYNYFLSKAITWRDRYQETGRGLLIQVIKFHVTIGITILGRMGLFAVLQLAGVNYLINAAIGIALSAVFNFMVYDTLIFKKERP